MSLRAKQHLAVLIESEWISSSVSLCEDVTPTQTCMLSSNKSRDEISMPQIQYLIRTD